MWLFYVKFKAEKREIICGDHMRCVYFDGKRCYADPSIRAVSATFMPSDEDKQEYCETKGFEDCPRLKTRLASKRI